MQFNKSKFNKGTFNTLDFIAYLALAQLNGSSYITTTSIRTQHTLSLLTGMGLVEASGFIIISIKSQLDGEGNIVAIPYAIYMPPFITIPTRFLIIDTVTLAVIEDTVTRIEFEDNQTKVVFI